MNGIDHDLDRTVREDGKRRWTPRLMTGAIICYALTGMMAVAMMSPTTPSPALHCGIEAPILIDPAVRPIVEPLIETKLRTPVVGSSAR